MGITGEWNDVLVVYHEWEEVVLGMAKVEQFQKQAIDRGLKTPDNSPESWDYFDGLSEYQRFLQLEAEWNELTREFE